MKVNRCIHCVVPSAPGGEWGKGLKELLRLGNLLLKQPPA